MARQLQRYTGSPRDKDYKKKQHLHPRIGCRFPQGKLLAVLWQRQQYHSSGLVGRGTIRKLLAGRTFQQHRCLRMTKYQLWQLLSDLLEVHRYPLRMGSRSDHQWHHSGIEYRLDIQRPVWPSLNRLGRHSHRHMQCTQRAI